MILHIEKTNWWSLGLAVLTIVLILLFSRSLSRHFPSTLAALALATLAGMALDAQSKGVGLAGGVPSIIPPLSLPPSLSLGLFKDLFMPALAIALLGAVQSLAIGQADGGHQGRSL